ncbi:MAG: SPASM domain-containing protein [Armatimonadota bacterium]
MSDSASDVTIRPYEMLVGEWPTRFHLRIDPDGSGLLLANAAEAAWLSAVGVRMAAGVLEGRSDQEIVEQIATDFRGAPASQIHADLGQVHAMIEELSQPGDNYPITNLTDPRLSHWERELAAPLRADVDQCEPERFGEIIRALWDAGVPHVSVQTDPGRDRGELMLLVEAAEDIGMICGLRAAAGWLSPEVIELCAVAGLDHLDLLFICHDPAEHDEVCGEADHEAFVAAVAQCRELELAPVAGWPLMDSNLGAMDEMAEALQGLGVTNVVGFAIACPDDDEAADAAGALPARALPQVATTFFELAEHTSARYLWAPPKRFDHAKSLREQILEGPRTSADVTVRVRADGTVWPARGAQSAGSILQTPWREIWRHPAFERYRERLERPTRCPDCPDLPICNADCPKDPTGWSDDREGGDAQ